MATSVPLSFKPQVPVTPPPDQHTFKGPFLPQSSRFDLDRAAYQGTGVKPAREMPRASVPFSTAHANPASTAASGAPEPASGTNSSTHNAAAADPRYLAMASRIASYYQQRCQAVANFQQQRCQVWANAQRAKCQEMMQAAMLVVAWYIRDRISRRRRRQRKTFKRGLKQRSKTSSKKGLAGGDSVRRWVMGLPSGAGTTASPRLETNQEKTLDKDEQDFEMDGADQSQDKDSHLFSVADSMIKSQLARIDVPLLGVLSFDESDDETDSEMEDDFEDEEEEDEDEGEEECEDFAQESDDGIDEEVDGYSDTDEGEPRKLEGVGSNNVHLGTSTKGDSRKRTTSSCV